MSTEKIYFLIGDIGGTNARLKLVNVTISNNPEIEEIYKKSYKITSDILVSTLKEFITECKTKYSITIQRAVFGVPGAIIANTVFLSVNLPCLNGVSNENLAKELGIEKVTFLNDFNINGYAIQSENMKIDVDYFQINPNVKPVKDAPIAMIGPGTGLGMGYLTKEGKNKYYNVYSSEGSSSQFLIDDEIEFKFCKFMKEKCNKKYLSYEDLCCGKTINLLYLFLSENFQIMNDKDKEIISEIKTLNENNKAQSDYRKINELIIAEGIKEGNTENNCLCTKATNIFIKIYAIICAQISLTYLPYGGLYLLGGISAALSKYMCKDNRFMNEYLKREDIAVILKNIPIFIVINSNFGVYGAEEYVKKVIYDKLNNKNE